MVKCEALKEFGCKTFNFNELKNIVRKDKNKNAEGQIYIGDTFECNDELAKYLSGENPLKQIAVETIEVTPESVDNVDKVVDKPKRGRRKKNVE